MSVTTNNREVRLLYLASNNIHKAEELKALTQHRFNVRLARELDPQIVWDETGTTFLANAQIKADVVRKLTRHAVLADDSGLVVDALNGAPGVYSSRYAGVDGDDKANNAKLLNALHDVPDSKRTARFMCTLVFVDEHGHSTSFFGACEGRILTAARGTHGFGYDPLFALERDPRSMAELTEAEKNVISHRSRAVAAWLQALG